MPTTDQWKLRNFADIGAGVGLGDNLIPYNVRVKEDGSITIRLERLVSHRIALDVWDGVQLATQSCDVVVIDAAGQETRR